MGLGLGLGAGVSVSVRVRVRVRVRVMTLQMAIRLLRSPESCPCGTPLLAPTVVSAVDAPG